MCSRLANFYLPDFLLNLAASDFVFWDVEYGVSNPTYYQTLFQGNLNYWSNIRSFNFGTGVVGICLNAFSLRFRVLKACSF